MPPIDYFALLQQEFEEYSTRLRQKQEIEYDLAQREQFIRATVNMLPEYQKAPWEVLLATVSMDDVGLSVSIRNVLKAAPRKFHTATEVKRMLVKNGFDFSKYTANPLSSVHAALKRLKPEEAELNQVDGVMAWRWVKQQLPYVSTRRAVFRQTRPIKGATKQLREIIIDTQNRDDPSGKIQAALKAIEEKFGSGAVYRGPKIDKKE